MAEASGGEFSPEHQDAHFYGGGGGGGRVNVPDASAVNNAKCSETDPDDGNPCNTDDLGAECLDGIFGTESYSCECTTGYTDTETACVPDADNDGIADSVDPDDDNDLVADVDEAEWNTDPFDSNDTPYIFRADADSTATFPDGRSWASAYADLQDAIGEVTDGVKSEIWVAEGIYYPAPIDGDFPPSRSSAFYLESNVSVYGGFAGDELGRAGRDWTTHVTILSGDIDQNFTGAAVNVNGVVTLQLDGDNNVTNPRGDNSYHVLNVELDSEIRVDGFTVTGGLADGTESTGRGGGLLFNSAGAVLENMIFEGNAAVGSGGAVWIGASQVTMANTTVRKNMGTTTFRVQGSVTQFSLQDSRVEDNPAVGFLASTDGGVYYVDRTSFLRNTIAVIVQDGAAATMSNSLIAGTSLGAARIQLGAVATFNNSSLIGNHLATGGAGLWVSASTVNLNNSVLWNNSSPDVSAADASVRLTGGGVANFNTSLVEDWSGDGLIPGDNPVIDVGETGTDYGTAVVGNLPAPDGSPLIDAGEASVVFGTLALDGNARTQGVSVDIGAYERSE